jgi:hypothetical protein
MVKDSIGTSRKGAGEKVKNKAGGKRGRELSIASIMYE